MSKNSIIKLLLFTGSLLGIAYFVVENVMPYFGIKPMRRKPEQLSWLLVKGPHMENYGLHGRPATVISPDSLKLSALIVESNTDTVKGVVLLIHGISACKEVDFERAELLANQGFASLLIDLRAHGQSEGAYCTFGYKERYDMRAVADSLSNWFPGKPLGVWGASLGGAVALQSMALEPRYRFGIIESTFDEFPKVAMEYGADMMFGLRSQWLTHHVLEKSGKIADFDPFSVKPVEAAAKIDCPVLFIHGDKDARIPMWFGQLNYEACPAKGKRWLKIHGGGHNDLWKKAGPEMKSNIEAFLAEIR